MSDDRKPYWRHPHAALLEAAALAASLDGEPDWSIWTLIPKATLHEAVALSCNIDPDRVEFTTVGDCESQPLKYKSRMKIALAHVGKGGSLKSEGMFSHTDQIVKLNDFAEWADRIGFSLPDEFPRQPLEQLPIQTKSWPWGEHETELLKHLAAAADRFWRLYDPTDNTTAPTNEQVSTWLQKEKGVAKRRAEVMASILRPDGLPTGPRK